MEFSTAKDVEMHTELRKKKYRGWILEANFHMRKGDRNKKRKQT